MIKKNENGRDFIVGDIHGHMGLLQSELEIIEFDKKKDRLFSVGDLIDRGPNSLDCLSLIFEPWFFAVRGNHEQMMFDALQGDNGRMLELWMVNGASWIYDVDIAFLREVSKQAEALMPVWLELETEAGLVGIVHAEPPEDWAKIHEENTQNLIWSRTKIEQEDKSMISGVLKVYVGHTPVVAPCNFGNTRFIDTGAFHTRNLTIEQIV
jgi:serine/threonine protein phosphatase 1